MYRVMIVDDEKYIRRSIINRIHWEKYQLEVVGEASNGEEAFAGIQLYQPDIVLVDIRMPILDGLGLIKLLKREYRNIKVIILSAYNDFSYARQAIQLGVEDYLLKPIDELELEKTLHKILSELNQETDSFQIPILDVAYWEQGRFAGRKFLVSSFYISQSLDELQWKLAVEDLYEQIRARSLQTLTDLSLFAVKWEQGDSCVHFVWNSNALNELECRQWLEQIVCSSMEHPQLRVGMSSVYWKPEETAKRLGQAVQALKYKVLFPQTLVFDKMYIQKEESKGFANSKKTISLFYGMVMREDWESARVLSQEFWGESFFQMQRLWEIEYLMEELLAVFKIMAQKSENMYEARVLLHRFWKKDYVLEYSDLCALKQDMKEILEILYSYQKVYQEKDVIKTIREYIQAHFMENLNTNTIAQMFHLNSNYLSTLFKEKSNITLTAYIEGVRMEKAKELLKTTELAIADIALAVGYLDANYFSKVFKRYTGRTPRQYRGEE